MYEILDKMKIISESNYFIKLINYLKIMIIKKTFN